MSTRAYQYVGERRYVDGVPFGSWVETGDCYVSGCALWEGDLDLLAERDEARRQLADAEAGSTRLRDAATEVIDEWGTEEWIRPTFEAALDRLRAALGTTDEPTDEASVLLYERDEARRELADAETENTRLRDAAALVTDRYLSGKPKLHTAMFALRAALGGTTDEPTSAKCPRCDSPDPMRHPAMQWEGEVQICPHPWHQPRRNPDTGQLEPCATCQDRGWVWEGGEPTLDQGHPAECPDCGADRG